MKTSPLSGERAEAFFREILNNNVIVALGFSELELLDILHRFLNGMNYLSSAYLHWWGDLEKSDVVDVGDESKRLDTLALKRANVGEPDRTQAGQEKRRERGFMPLTDDPREIVVLTTCSNVSISKLKELAA